MDTTDHGVLHHFESTGALANDLTGIKMRRCGTYLYFQFELIALEMKI
jgi:hypothetical protein